MGQRPETLANHPMKILSLDYSLSADIMKMKYNPRGRLSRLYLFIL